jgi:serine/threonine protein kinase
MSETPGQDGLNDLPDRPSDHDPEDVSLGDSGVFDPAAALFGHPQPEPTDDAPTVISKQAPRPASTEEVLAGVLRGKTLAHFELLEPVGVGGMAAVLRARDTHLDRIVALKVLPPDMSADPENVRRFHQEARSAAKLDHENIARVFFCGEDQKLHFIAFEYVEGENLRVLIERRGRLPVAEAVHYMLQLATGLAHAAARGVVHRDIKPSNIIITPNGRAKLVDMGLARSLAPHQDEGLTQSGVTLGTFDYISPEQAIEPREADVRSDIYSLGCTFYHALTGQPPVPEGTAAKKLHHHQQVPPVDPRQLNPDIPDEVAAILARMMAKDPKARYQRPEHLVQHLLAAAQKLGAISELPEGVLYVDAALPEPPRVRPILLAAVGVLAVIVLVLLFGSSNWTASSDRTGEPATIGPKERTDSGSPAKGPGANPDPRDPKNPTVVKQAPARDNFDSPTMKDLTEFILNHPDAPEYDLGLSGDVRLEGWNAEAEAAFSLLVPGRKLTLHATDPDKPPTIWIPYLPYADSRLKSSPRWTGLLLRADEIALVNLRFVSDAKDSNARMAAVVLQGKRDKVIGCEFIQYQPSFSDAERLTSLLVDGTRPGPKSEVRLQGCVFLGPHEFSFPSNEEEEKRVKPAIADIAKGGQDAVTVAGAANLHAESCAFGPHTALFAFESGGQSTGKATVQHCTAITSSGEWSAFRFADGATCDSLDVRHCLFARADAVEPMTSGMMGAGNAVLIRQAGATRIHYEGMGNRYYRLDGFWVRSADDAVATTFDTFQAETVRQGGKEEKGRLLGAAPWVFDRPLDPLQQSASSGNLRDVFRLKDTDRDLRQVDKPSLMVGVGPAVWGGTYEKLPDLDPIKPTPAGRRLVVDPDSKENAEGVYRKLNAALEEADPGEVILIKHDGLLALDLARLAKPSADVTIKPYPDYHPILTMANAPEKDAALFTVHDGKLMLEDLEFRLQPNSDKLLAQVLVNMAQNGACTFKNCVITLNAAQTGTVAVVALDDPGRAIKMDKGKPEARPESVSGLNARVNFDHCFVRGDGDLVWARVSRAFDFECANSLVALNGSLLNVEVGRDDAPAAPAGQATNVKLSRLTAYLGGYLVRLKAGRELKSLVPVHCKPITECIFVAADKKTTLIHLDGPSANEDKMKTLVQWEGGKNNSYSDFTSMLDQQPPENSMDMSAAPYGQKEWNAFSGESDGKFTNIKFVGAPALDKLAQTTPANFKVREADPQVWGVEIDKLPRPGIGDESRPDSD